MASEIDLCNRALSEIGTRSTISSFSEGSEESIQCALWYDKLRQMLLRAAPWGFARELVTLSALGSASAGTSQYPWPYMYAHPTEALRVRYILPPTPPVGDQTMFDLFQQQGPSRHNRFIISGARNALLQPIKVVLATLKDAQAVIISDVTDVSLFDPSFDVALSALLSFKLCIPLSGNVAMRQDFRATAESMITAARVADGNEAMPTTDHTPDWISARGDGTVYPFNFSEMGNWYLGYDNLDWGS